MKTENKTNNKTYTSEVLKEQYKVSRYRWLQSFPGLAGYDSFGMTCPLHYTSNPKGTKLFKILPTGELELYYEVAISY